jgi:peptidoglycan/LPS O-acetylase OafA/YrhL
MPKLYTLDAMRGIAAFMVAAYHFGLLRTEWQSPYLAVDFFFALSGFVIAYSYDRKLSEGMAAEEFIRRRLIRLYPLFVFGLLLGFAVTLAGQAHGFVQNDGPLLLQLFTSLVFLPFLAVTASNVVEGSVAPLNGPYWSLLLEIHINVLFAIFFRWLKMWLLSILLALLGIAIAAMAWTEGYLGGGYLTREFHYGIIRVGFSFLVGVLICRLRHRLRMPRLHWGAVLALTAGLLVLPRPESMQWIYDAVCVLVLFPLLILAGTQSQPRGEKLITTFAWVGGASYALYAIHMPVTMLVEVTAEANELIPYRVWIVGFLLLTVAAAFAAYRFYDIPVRRWLSDWYRRSRQTQLTTAQVNG